MRLGALSMAVTLWLLRTSGVLAFPLIDLTNQDQVPQGTELAAPDAQDLQHQLEIANGLAPPAGGGWTFVPRIDVQELLTDNVEEQHSPRQADLVSYFAPGFSLAGDLPRLQVSLSYAPTLSIYTRTGSLNSLTNQLNGLATVTLMPDLAYVDVRALSGVHNLYGGLGGIGTIGAPAGAGATAQTAIPTLAGNAAGPEQDERGADDKLWHFAIPSARLRRLGNRQSRLLAWRDTIGHAVWLRVSAASDRW